MKIKGAKKVHYDSGPNMTPLVDVVMVILIFLMLAGSFGGAARFLVSKEGIKASGGHGRPLRPGEMPDVTIDVHVTNSRDGVGFIAQLPGIAPTGDADEVEKLLSAKLKQFNNAGTVTSRLQVVLYPDRRVKYKYLIAIYQAALQAKYEKIAFATSH
jgi:biopolymer transport protein ExbD